MTKDEFKLRFIAAIKESIARTRKFVLDNLSDEVSINLYSRDKKEINFRLDVNGAIDKLYHDGKIPKWVNVNVVKVDQGYTVIECEYSDIFLDDDRLLQFPDDSFSPFKPSGPYLPLNWEGLEKSGKFELLKYDEELGRPLNR